MAKKLFISYSTKDKEIANDLVEYIEKENEYNCFIAPRDIHDGEYAQQIVDAIELADAVVLIYSESANTSSYVLREMNSAVLRSVPIIPYRIDNSELSRSMEFYLGVVQWLDAYKMSREESFSALKTWLPATTVEHRDTRNVSSKIQYQDYAVLGYKDLKKLGYNTQRVVMETMEIDYVSLNENSQDYVLNEELEGSYEDWELHVRQYPDIYSILIQNDKAVGYYQYELINKDNYDLVLSGKAMIHPKMMEFYGFGGRYYLYIAMLSLLKDHENMSTMLLLLDDMFKRIIEVLKMNVEIPAIAISVYSSFLKKVVSGLGFRHVENNLSFGDIYELDLSTIETNAALRNRYPIFYQLIHDRYEANNNQ